RQSRSALSGGRLPCCGPWGKRVAVDSGPPRLVVCVYANRRLFAVPVGICRLRALDDPLPRPLADKLAEQRAAAVHRQAVVWNISAAVSGQRLARGAV